MALCQSANNRLQATAITYVKTCIGNGTIDTLALRSTLFGGEWSASRLGRSTSGKEALVAIEQEAGRAAAWVWAFWEEDSLVSL